MVDKHMDAHHFEANEWADILHSMDTDDDQRIDFTEFLAAAYSKQKLLNHQNLIAAFKVFDLDGDGTIGKEEVKKVFNSNIKTDLNQRFEIIWNKIIERAHTDNEHHFTFEEFERAMHKVLDD